jgi:uncharacterized protein (TIGR03435 family)
MKTKALVITLTLMLIAAAAVKMMFFPSVKDACFSMDARSLQEAPAGLLVVRPTHFAFLRQKGILRIPAPHSPGGTNQWIMGRNVSLADVMAAAYDRNPSRVVLPPETAAGRFDFLVTAAPVTRFQATIRHQLGYTAQMETRDASVLALKVADASLPGLKAAGADEKRGVVFRNEKLQFTQMPLKVIVNIFGRFFEMPLVDQTGLTNFYDFSLNWNAKTEQRYEDGTMTPDELAPVIGPLGLKIEPDMASLDMLVVKKTE